MYKTFILALLISGATAHAGVQHYYIISDSLSSPTGCEWPLQLQGAIHNYAQAGLTLAAFDLPHHFRTEPNSKAIIYIGTNDAGAGYKVSAFKQQLKELVSVLRSRNMAQIYIVAQPYLDIHESKLNTFRAVTKAVAQEVAATYLDPGWGTSSTMDGVHPSCVSNMYLGWWIRQQLEG